MSLMKIIFLFFACICFNAAAHATKVQEIVSDKGLTAWLVEEHSLPLLAVRVAFKKSGSAYDPKSKEGLANMTAALLMEGAGNLDARSFAEALESHAIAMNMNVDEDFFNASAECLSEHADKTFSYLGMALTNPRFDSSSIKRVKSQTISIINQQKTRPGYILHRGWQEIAYGNHPYGRPAIGTQNSINSLDSYDFRHYLGRYLTKENIVISVVGDITPDKLKKLLDKYFSALPKKYNPDSKIKNINLPVEAKTKIIQFDIPQTMVTFGTQGIKRKDPDYMTAYVMNHMLGGGTLNTRLGKEIREKRGLAYSVFSYLNPMDYAASWKGGFATRNEQAITAVDILKKTLRDFASNGPTKSEFEDSKKYLKGAFVLKLGSNANIAHFLSSMQINELGIDYLEKRNRLVDNVSKEAVEDMARRLADDSKILTVMVGKPTAPEPEAKK